ncbi:MAG: CPBP family intramembrane metalloprotease [Clostridia bacterium]|nr:CPBP family intramembrane metalloprotease [Clostridia bacterium]
MKNKITVTGANILFFIFVMLFLVFQIVLVVLSIIYGADYIDRNIYPVLLVNQYVLILIPVLVFMRAGNYSFKEVFRINSPGILPGILIVFCSLVAYPIANFINCVVVYLLQFIGKIPAQPIPVPQNYTELAVGILIVAVSPAICEEMLHRGVLLKAYENRGSIKAVFITSVIFGFFHFDITNFFGPIFLGILIGYYVIRTNSIFAGMLAHFINNAFAEVLQYLARNDVPAEKTITIQLPELGEAAVAGAVGMLILWVLLIAFKHVTKERAVLKPSIAGVKEDVISVVSHWPIIVVLVFYLLLGGLTILSMMLEK